MPEIVDALVIGGGPAGLLPALNLARYDRTVSLFDAGGGRSSHGQINRNYLGFPGGVAVFVVQGAAPRTGLARSLGVDLAETGWIAVDSEQRTNVEGVFAAGDVTSLHSHQVATAVHEGNQAAAAANQLLYPEQLRAP